MRGLHSITQTQSIVSSSSRPKITESHVLLLSLSVVLLQIFSLGDSFVFLLLLTNLCSVFSLPDGKVFMVANNQSIIYDIEQNTETILPDIPNSVRVTNPFDGSAILLPLSPPDFTPEVLVCGKSSSNLSWYLL